ncbi:DivIVA domain-containing protein [Microbacterium sp. BK668]|uniref:DivIVA domain-containing protein n=1 Tax=Microbacterium sp. BK668 TaxID=2512118 RepID=UPI0010CE9884|nr:DivIVA domain-containing protein [Microbacterium sp. BK668]TDN90634.1 DivIVA domain-containing protein [Microbacterium sp. BK668]
MPDQQTPARNAGPEDASPFDELMIGGEQSPVGPSFTTVFRGYDKDEVDAAVARLTARLRAEGDEIALLEQRYRDVSDTANAQSMEAVGRIEAEYEAKLAAADARSRETIDRLKAALNTANARLGKVQDRVQAEVSAADERSRETIERLEAELTAATARAAKAESQVQALSDELVDSGGQDSSRPQFEEILRVAEDQASLIIRNATVQADRLLEASREEIAKRRKEVQVEADGILAQAHHDAQQARLRIDTELTAHQARLEREAAHAAEKVSQAEQEAVAIRTEAEKGAASLRSMVARETSLARQEAEEAVRELRLRALEFEESLTRRQNDAQQEFLVLHNQAVAHAERITQDANDQVAASLEHAQRVASKADDFDRLMRAQAAQIEADASIRARETLDRARDKAQKIIETVTSHSQGVLRDAEDRTRQLRWQQHQLTSFMAEVRELIRPETPFDASADVDVSADGEASAGHADEETTDAAAGPGSESEAHTADGGTPQEPTPREHADN